MRRKNGEGSISVQKRNGKDYYIGQVSFVGRSGDLERQTFGSNSMSKLIEKMKEFNAEVVTNTITANKDIRFGEFFKNWIFQCKKPVLKSSSFETYFATYELRIQRSFLANIKVSKMETMQLQKFINKVYEEKKSVPTTKKTLMHIKSCLEYAIGQDILFKNPAKYVTLPRENENDLVKYKKQYYGSFSSSEQIKIIDHLDLIDPVEQIIYMGFATGARLGELLALKWDDWTGSKIEIYKQLRRRSNISENGLKQWEYLITSLKTEESNRSIPLPKKANMMLSKAKLNQSELRLMMGEEYDYNGFIFADEYGKPIENKRPTRRLKKICKDLGIEERPFHSTRHSYATRLLEAGTDIKIIQTLLGHANARTTMEIYVDVHDEKKEETVQKLDAFF